MVNSRTRRALGISAALAACCGAGAAWLGYLAGRDHPAAFEKKVQQIEAARSGLEPETVVLTGSSFIERWTRSADDLAPLETVNIGIGGTKIGDHIEYLQRMVVPLAPRAVVVYAGSNDINGIPFFSKPGDQVAARVREYIRELHDRLPQAQVFYIAITETPSRRRVRGDIKYANRLIKAMAAAEDFVFIDTAPALLTTDGDIDRTLFGPDRLHFNDLGYRRFAAVIRGTLHPHFGLSAGADAGTLRAAPER